MLTENGLLDELLRFRKDKVIRFVEPSGRRWERDIAFVRAHFPDPTDAPAVIVIDDKIFGMTELVDREIHLVTAKPFSFVPPTKSPITRKKFSMKRTSAK